MPDDDHPWVRSGTIRRPKDAPAEPRQQYAVFKDGALSKQKWVSMVAPGTPVGYETMFEAIKSNQYDTKAFNYAKKVHGVSDADLWSYYSEWIEGKIHPELLEKIQKGNGDDEI